MEIVTLSLKDGTLVGVNPAQVSYVLAHPEGGTRLVFGSGSNARLRENALTEGPPDALAIEVAESFDDVMLALTTP